MKAHATLAVILLWTGICGRSAAQGTNQDLKSYTYQTSVAQKQSATEIDDIGVLEPRKKGFSSLRDKLRFSVSVREAYTTNALLQGSHRSSDALFLPTLEAGFRTALGDHFSFDLSTKVETVLYSKYDEKGFAGYSALATLDYRFKKNAPRVYVSVEPYRFDGYDTGEMLSQAIGFTGGTDWGIAFNGGRSLGFVGYSFTSYQADPSIDSRLANRAVVGMAHQIRSNLTAQVYYVFQHNHFTDFDRDDSKHSVAGNLIYQFNDHWFGNLTTSFVNSDSTDSRASYESFSTTLGVTVQF